TRDHFRIGRRGEGLALRLERSPQFLRVDDVAVVADRDGAVRAHDDDRSGVDEPAATGGGIARMADCQRPGKVPDVALLEVLSDQTHPGADTNSVAIPGSVACALLS